METTYLIICIVAVVGTAIIGYLLGKKSGEARCNPLQERIGELQGRVGERKHHCTSDRGDTDTDV